MFWLIHESPKQTQGVLWIFFVVNYKNSKTPPKNRDKKIAHISVGSTLCLNQFMSPRGKAEGYYEFFLYFYGKKIKMPKNIM